MAFIPNLPRRDFWTILSALAIVIVLSWVYLFSMADGMSAPSAMEAMKPSSWTAEYFFMMFVMWAVMMAGMMLPSVAPTVLIYAAVARKSIRQGNPVAPSGVFVSGYIFMWIGFSLLATAAQWRLEETALLSPMMVSKSSVLGAGLLTAAGIYQWSPVKETCLEHCRSPAHFISSHWRPGTLGAFRMGLSHGLFCLGCCWVLMGLLFVGGVMNLLWVAVITIFIFLEKLLPTGPFAGRATGLLMILSGVALGFTGI